MNRNELAERLYALPDGIVVKGRKSLLPSALLAAAGVALLIVNGLLPARADYGDWKSALVLFGGVIFAAGVSSLLVRLFGGSGVPALRRTAGSADLDGTPLRQIGCDGRGRLPDASRLGAVARRRTERRGVGASGRLPYGRRCVRGLSSIRIRGTGGAPAHGAARRAARRPGVASVLGRGPAGLRRAVRRSGRFAENKLCRYVVDH